MDLFKAQLARIQQQLSGLTASQKMLSATLVIIMGMTLVWWGKFAGQAEMVPLLDQSFTQEDIGQITANLDQRNIPYTVSTDRIMVPADRTKEALGVLSFNHLLPNHTDQSFDEMLKQMTPWDPADKTNHLWLNAKQNYLADVIEKMPGVRDANVMIDEQDERRLDGHDVTPSAAVYITTTNPSDNGPSLRQIANAAADLVAAAVADLTRSRVTVVVDSTTIPIRDKNTATDWTGDDDMLGATRQWEQYYCDKIKQELSFIPTLSPSVTVDLNTKNVETQDTSADPKKSAQMTTGEETETTDTPMPAPAAEPGASSNLSANGALAVGGGGAGGGGSATTDKSKTTSEVVIGTHTEHSVQPAGDAKPIAAAVRVPRSYFVEAYKNDHKGSDPDDGALDQEIKDELDRIRQDVKSCTGITADAAVTVNVYSDATPTLSMTEPAANSHTMMLVETHARDIGVAGLAMFSLFMVLMMVRKSVPVPIPETVEETTKGGRSAPHIGGDTPLAGEVAEGDRTLDGMELDDEAMKTQQVIEQVSNMVTENPDAAANLVKRWLNRS
jgi:flagellar biosynthesis/type III secretory pathway M-ring protein FliF/YscJ